MSIEPDAIQQQLLGAIQALEKLSAKEREQRPYREFGENYNNLLSLAKEAMPSVDSRRWPPALTITLAAMGPSHLDARYVEIHAYMKQIISILAEATEGPLAMTMG
jgi:hypothetical protein